MEFQSERAVINTLAETIVKSGVSLYNAVKYIYSLTDEDFYNCSIKDVLKVVLNNITETNCLKNMGLSINSQKCSEMESESYNKVLSIMVYSFAVRIPLLKRVKFMDETMTDDQLKEIYSIVLSKGAENYLNAVTESYDGIKKLVRQGKDILPYSADWYKSYIYTYVPALSEIKNKNVYLLGAVDILFTMFDACLFEKLTEIINESDKL